LELLDVLEAAKYSAFESLRDGRTIEIRALKAEDQAGLIAVHRRSSAQSLYGRFFGFKPHFSDQEIAYFMNVDFLNHVALISAIKEGGRPVIVGGGRYVVHESGKAEIALAVVDEYQGQGIGGALMRHLAGIAHDAGLKELTAEVLPDNIISMLRVFEKSGLRFSIKRESIEREPQVVHITLQL
jgi:GNAT superfamily N-acetyltransferase